MAALVLLPFIDAATAVAAAQAPRAEIQVNATEISVGDRLTVRVDIEHAVGDSVVWPESLDIGPFELLEASIEPTVIEGDRALSRATFVLTAFELGELELPSLEIEVEDAAGNESTVTTDPYGIEVRSIGLDEGSEIRDLKGPRSMARNWLLLWPWALGFLIATAVAWWLVRRLREGTAAPAPSRPTAPLRPAHEIAYERLAELERSPLLARGQVKKYYVGVSEILRAYLEGRYGINALEMTSSEILAKLHSAGLSRTTRDDFCTFLEACDLVKFAKHRPDRGARGSIVPRARALVDATRPPTPPIEPEVDTEDPSAPEPRSPSSLGTEEVPA